MVRRNSRTWSDGKQTSQAARGAIARMGASATSKLPGVARARKCRGARARDSSKRRARPDAGIAYRKKAVGRRVSRTNEDAGSKAIHGSNGKRLYEVVGARPREAAPRVERAMREACARGPRAAPGPARAAKAGASHASHTKIIKTGAGMKATR